jgi:hypothetical protein
MKTKSIPLILWRIDLLLHKVPETNSGTIAVAWQQPAHQWEPQQTCTQQ